MTVVAKRPSPRHARPRCDGPLVKGVGMVKRIDQRSEIEQAEAGLRRGVLFGLLLSIIVAGIVVMLVVAMGLADGLVR